MACEYDVASGVPGPRAVYVRAVEACWIFSKGLRVTVVDRSIRWPIEHQPSAAEDYMSSHVRCTFDDRKSGIHVMTEPL